MLAFDPVQSTSFCRDRLVLVTGRVHPFSCSEDRDIEDKGCTHACTLSWPRNSSASLCWASLAKTHVVVDLLWGYENSTTFASAGDVLDVGGSAGPINFRCSSRLQCVSPPAVNLLLVLHSWPAHACINQRMHTLRSSFGLSCYHSSLVRTFHDPVLRIR